MTKQEKPAINLEVRTFKCNCKAAQYREGLCKHARAVIEYIEGLPEIEPLKAWEEE